MINEGGKVSHLSRYDRVSLHLPHLHGALMSSHVVILILRWRILSEGLWSVWELGAAVYAIWSYEIWWQFRLIGFFHIYCDWEGSGAYAMNAPISSITVRLLRGVASAIFMKVTPSRLGYVFSAIHITSLHSGISRALSCSHISCWDYARSWLAGYMHVHT